MSGADTMVLEWYPPSVPGNSGFFGSVQMMSYLSAVAAGIGCRFPSFMLHGGTNFTVEGGPGHCRLARLHCPHSGQF